MTAPERRLRGDYVCINIVFGSPADGSTCGIGSVQWRHYVMTRVTKSNRIRRTLHSSRVKLSLIQNELNHLCDYRGPGYCVKPWLRVLVYAVANCILFDGEVMQRWKNSTLTYISLIIAQLIWQTNSVCCFYVCCSVMCTPTFYYVLRALATVVYRGNRTNGKTRRTHVRGFAKLKKSKI